MQLIHTPAAAFKSLSGGTNKAKNNNFIGFTLKNTILWLQKIYDFGFYFKCNKKCIVNQSQ